MKDMIIDPNSVDFGKYLEDVSFLEAQSLRDAAHFAAEVGELAEDGEQVKGVCLPWDKTKNVIRIDNGMLSIWAGESASGKSLLLGQVITEMMSQGRKAVIASLEMPPKKTLYRMICQSATCRATAGYSYDWLGHHTGKLWIYDQLDQIATDRVLGMAHYAAHELGCNDIVIDSLTKCGLSRDDYAAQATFVSRLQWCAKRWNVHIHLVCHMRKPSQTAHKGGKADIRGAAEITDLADNVFILRRNKQKEKEAELMEHGQDYDDKILQMPCAFLDVAKNRDNGIETEFGLWFSKKCGRYLNSETQPLRPLVV